MQSITSDAPTLSPRRVWKSGWGEKDLPPLSGAMFVWAFLSKVQAGDYKGTKSVKPQPMTST